MFLGKLQGNISFSSKADFSTGTRPFSISAGDLDGDGKLDLLVANSIGNTLSLFRNTSSGAGNISFTGKIDLFAGSYPFGTIINDFDRDGKPDLASANSSSGTISVFKNNSTPGALSFLAKIDFITGASPFWLAAGDLNNDGKPDLASANGVASNSVSILRNTSTPGNISFAPKSDFDGGPYAFSIAMGDLDGDGKTDLAVAGENNGALGVLLNTSTGTGNISFAQRSTFYAGSSAFGITLSDLDGDTKADMIIANSTVNSISVLKNKSVTGFLNFDQKKDF